MTIQILQETAWFLALIQFILGLYILVLNPRHIANRHVSLFLINLAAVSYATGMMIGARNFAQGAQPAVILSLTSTAVEPFLLIVILVLIKPSWIFRSDPITAKLRIRWYWFPLYFMVVFPAALTLLDIFVNRGSALFFTGLNSQAYAGGLVPTFQYANGILARSLRLLNFSIIAFASILILFYLALFDKKLTTTTRRIAWLLLGAQILTGIIYVGLINQLSVTAQTLVASAIFAFTYSYAGFQQMISEQRLQKGSLQTRLTSITLVVSLPVLIGMALFLTDQARTQLEQNAVQNLEAANQSLSGSISIWLDYNSKALQELVSQPDVVSMDPARLQPILKSFAANYPGIELATVIDLNGTTIARSDDQSLESFAETSWFQKALQGAPVTYQTGISRPAMGKTRGNPVMIIAVPIHNAAGQVLGIGMFSNNLDLITKQVQASRLGRRGTIYILDAQNQVVSQPVINESNQLSDLSSYPPVVALRQGLRGNLTFVEPSGTRVLAGTKWRANVDTLYNNWAVIVQLPEDDLFAPIIIFRTIAWLGLAVGTALIFGMSVITIRKSIHPVKTLTETATAIAAGDLNRQAPIESEDELSVLARTFNTMTSQLRSLISGLENRVTERTHALERRAVQFQVTAEVARDAAAFRDLEQLLENTVKLISNRFGFYHAGIFLVDDRGGYAVLRAASSQGGENMLARGHKLKVGQTGIVGYVASKGASRIALDVGTDAVYFDNPDLPNTRSEVALPLKNQGQVIGVLDVQSTEASAFSEEDLEILQILADQVALAINNANLLAESQRAIRELESLYRSHLQQAWEEELKNRAMVYIYDQMGVKRADISTLQNLKEETLPVAGEEGDALILPIELRGQRLGSIKLRRKADEGPWLPEEKDLAVETISQVALSLENARLLEEVERHAAREESLNQISAEFSGSLDVDSVLRTVVRELGRLPNVVEASVHVGVEQPAKSVSGNGQTRNGSKN